MNKKFQQTLSAAAKLVLFSQRELPLTVDQFDECMDVLIDALEEANNEKHRLTTAPTEQG